MMQNKILVIGAAFVDVIIEVPQLPSPGEDVTGDFQKNQVGGSAFNVYGALNYAEATADLLAPVGRGPYADIVTKTMQQRQFPILLQDDIADNGWDISLVEPSGERSFITMQGIDQLWKSEWFDSLDFQSYQYFYISGYETEQKESLTVILNQLRTRRPDSYIVFDVSPRVQYMTPETIDSFLHSGVIIHGNEDEIKYLSSYSTVEDQLQDIYSKTNSPVIVTLGNRGAGIYDQNGFRIIAGEEVEAFDTIGAGDTHCGGILAGLQRGLSIDGAVKLGNQLSALVIGRRGGSL